MYDKIEALESQPIEPRAKKSALDCREKLRHVRELKFAYIALNISVIIGLCVSCRETVFRFPALAVALPALQPAAFYIAHRRNSYWFSALCMGTLCLLDLRFLILTVVSIFLPRSYSFWKTP